MEDLKEAEELDEEVIPFCNEEDLINFEVEDRSHSWLDKFLNKLL